jgi:uncharacterized damage-inducible protein DinB
MIDGVVEELHGKGTAMPGMPGPVRDETEGLLSFLAHQRRAMKLAAYGLTDEQARAAPSASALSVGGLIKHVALTERDWVQRTVLQRLPPGDVDEYAASFVMGDDETLADLFTLLDEVAAETEAAVAEIGDLDRPVPVPQNVPWFPQDVEAWSLRWVLLHLIEEVARHAGHADIVRESVDGATQFELLAADEGWPESPWLKPWEPEVAQ